MRSTSDHYLKCVCVCEVFVSKCKLSILMSYWYAWGLTTTLTQQHYALREECPNHQPRLFCVKIEKKTTSKKT